MTDIIVRDIEPALLERIKRIGEARRLGLSETLLTLLHAGLEQYGSRGSPPLNTVESGALDAAIKAMEQVPDDAGFSLIGRADPGQTK